MLKNTSDQILGTQITDCRITWTLICSFGVDIYKMESWEVVIKLKKDRVKCKDGWISGQALQELCLGIFLSYECCIVILMLGSREFWPGINTIIGFKIVFVFVRNEFLILLLRTWNETLKEEHHAWWKTRIDKQLKTTMDTWREPWNEIPEDTPSNSPSSFFFRNQRWLGKNCTPTSGLWWHKWMTKRRKTFIRMHQRRVFNQENWIDVSFSLYRHLLCNYRYNLLK